MSTASTAPAVRARLCRAGQLTFFFSGICAISSGVVVSLLQEQYGFDYGMTGTLLSLMSIGNLLAGFASGVLPGKIGAKPTVLLLTTGYAAGYLLMGLTGLHAVLMSAFFLVGLAKGCTLNTCTLLISSNAPDRTRGMNIMHACYACGALLCPFILAAAARRGAAVPVFVLAALGAVLWARFAATPFAPGDGGAAEKPKTDWSFLQSRRFWLLTGLLFCQNAAETGVTGWMVTYFKGSGILSGALSPYTVTVMWGATLLGRLLLAFVFPIRDACRAMVKMGAGCIVFYLALMLARTQTAALVLLFAFAFAMAGMNPTAIASAGRMTSVTSMGVMLPAAASGAILMPWLVGLVAERAGLGAGMGAILVPCVGMLVFAVLVGHLPKQG